MGPAQRVLVAGGLGGGQHGLANVPEISPVSLAAQDIGLAGEQLPGMGDQARRGGLDGGLEQDLVLGLDQSSSSASSASISGTTPGAGAAGVNGRWDKIQDGHGVQVVVQAAARRRPDPGLANCLPGLLAA